MGNRVTRAEFARMMGVHRSAVTRWVNAGRIRVDADGLIDPEAARRSLIATESPEPHHQARMASIEAEKAIRGLVADEDEIESKEDLAMRMKRAMAKEREAKAELAAMERDRQAGLLVERSEVEFVMTDIGLTFRTALEAMPDRLAPLLAGYRGDVNAIHAGLEDAVHSVLSEIIDHMTRRAEEVSA